MQVDAGASWFADVEVTSVPMYSHGMLVSRTVSSMFALGSLIALSSACSSSEPPAASAVAAGAGEVTYEIEQATHVTEPVEYEQSPPVGGPHHPAWQNCGVYDDVVPNETAVHSLEHGAVWIAYDAEAVGDPGSLERFAMAATHVLVSPFDDPGSPVVASAWGVQQRFDDVDDPALAEFIQRHQLSPASPEPGAPCSGGVGEPR